jgi:PAS domain S-box-containing protein
MDMVAGSPGESPLSHFGCGLFLLQEQSEDFLMTREPTYEELVQRVNELEDQAEALQKVEEDLLREKDFSESVINSMPGIFYVFDEQRLFLRWNENFEKMTEHSAEEFSKTFALEHIAEEDKEVAADAIQGVFVKGKSHVEVNLVSKSGKKTPYYLAGLRTRIDNCTYLIGMGIDNTVRKHAEEERERLIAKLQKALYNIKTLKGLLPICAKCKSIRDDKGYWSQIEKYIESNSDASFTHGVCPECMDKLYGDEDWYKKKGRA